MTKQQKFDRLLEIVGDLIELGAFDSTFALASKKPGHHMSDATFERLCDLGEIYNKIDHIDYQTRITRGVSAATDAIKEMEKL